MNVFIHEQFYQYNKMNVFIHEQFCQCIKIFILVVHQLYTRNKLKNLKPNYFNTQFKCP